MPLPLRSPNVNIPDNKPLAVKRFNGLRKRFTKQPEFMRDYFGFMKDVLTDVVEEVPKDTKPVIGRINYVPHTGIYHPKKPGQIRVVFDCSAMYQGTSLNERLLPGPNQINSLLGILLRFRQENVAIMADIKGMFHQFFFANADRELLRFLWFKDNNPNNEVIEYRMMVHLFGATSSPGCSNFGLKRAAEDGEKCYGKEEANFIKNDFYVDDGPCLQLMKQ
ncbi:uncharacterized protein [Antedon mediterranea]|uniref:uncharacterized protein n=1 Tax=Antedon mediterranea TaxID=105859 RepID=UPI003AF91F4A